MDVPIIHFFRIKSISNNFITLEWDTEDAHHVEIKGIGMMGFDAECQFKRVPEKRYEYILMARNLESKLVTTATVEVFPAPIIEKFQYELLKGANIHLKAEVRNAVKVRYNGLDLPFQNSLVISRKLLKVAEVSLIVDGKNEGEQIKKTLPIAEISLFSKNKILIFSTAGFLLLLVLCGIIFNSTNKQETISKMSFGNNDYTFTCEEDSNMAAFVEKKLKKLLPLVAEISLEQRNAEAACIEKTLAAVDIIMVVPSSDGDNFYKLFDYLKKESPQPLAFDSLAILKKDKIRIYAKTISETARKEGKITTQKIDKIATIPALFQGKLGGRIRRLEVKNQVKKGNFIEFQYTILGVVSEQNKTGKLNAETEEIVLETLGNGICLVVEGRMIWQFLKDEVTFDSI